MATAMATRIDRKQTAGKRPPNAATSGRFGVYGGRYVPETLMAALDELSANTKKPSVTANSSNALTTC